MFDERLVERKIMTRIEVPSETLLVEMGEDGLNILETTMQMSGMDESSPVQCDICSKPLGKMKDVKHIESPETITIAVRNGFKPEDNKKSPPLPSWPPMDHVRCIVTRRESSEGRRAGSQTLDARRGFINEKCQGNPKPQMNANERRFKWTCRRK